MSRYTYLIDILISTGSISDLVILIKLSVSTKDKCGLFVQVQDTFNINIISTSRIKCLSLCLQFLLRWWTVDTGQQTWCSTGHCKH